jgi:hypothetical protein
MLHTNARSCRVHSLNNTASLHLPPSPRAIFSHVLGIGQNQIYIRCINSAGKSSSVRSYTVYICTVLADRTQGATVCATFHTLRVQLYALLFIHGVCATQVQLYALLFIHGVYMHSSGRPYTGKLYALLFIH